MFFAFLRKLRRDERGATALEYGLLAALIGAAGIVALSQIGTSLSSIYNVLSDEMDEPVEEVSDQSSQN